MNAPANIYSIVAHDLHPKVSEYLKKMDDEGQIDYDDQGFPYLLSAEKTGPNWVVQFVRNGHQENFVMNTRKRSDPIKSFDPLDGYRRRGGKKVIIANPDEDAPRPERQKRSFESFRRLTAQILQG
jgi:hypothetical protein